MTAEELIVKWERSAKLLRQCQHENPAYLPFAVKLEVCARELAAILPEIRREARLQEAEYSMVHEDTYEGSCGVHMPRFCAKCQRLAELQGPPKESVTCQHCGRPIEMRNGNWRHTMYNGAYCTKPAQPGPPETAKEQK